MTVRSPKYHQLNIFTIISSNVAIWLTNLPLLIGVQTTLLASGCHDLGHALKESVYLTTVLWLKANWLWSSVVCTIVDKDIRHHSGHCNLYSYLQRFSLIHSRFRRFVKPTHRAAVLDKANLLVVEINPVNLCRIPSWFVESKIFFVSRISVLKFTQNWNFRFSGVTIFSRITDLFHLTCRVRKVAPRNATNVSWYNL